MDAATLPALGEFNVQADRAGTHDKSAKYMYWKKADGWIISGGAWPQEFTRQAMKGMTPLPQYGQFTDWDRNSPYDRILRLGGAHEFSVEQILELGWHRKPPIPGIVFPQLEGVEFTDVQCSFCRRWYKDAHDLKRHESIAHKDISQQQSLARHLSEATTGQLAGPLGELMKMIVEGQQQQGAVIAELLERLVAVEEAKSKK